MNTNNPRYRALAAAIQALANCNKPPVNPVWASRWNAAIRVWSDGDRLSPYPLDRYRSTADRLVFTDSGPRYDEHGYHVGYRDVTVYVYPDLAHGVRYTFVGGTENEREYIVQGLDPWLHDDVPRIDKIP